MRPEDRWTKRACWSIRPSRYPHHVLPAASAAAGRNRFRIGPAVVCKWIFRAQQYRGSLELTPDLGKLPRDVELSLFRIVQECLTNIHRHSGSSTARVRLFREPGEVYLEVRDEGKGIPADVRENLVRRGFRDGYPGNPRKATAVRGPPRSSIQRKWNPHCGCVPDDPRETTEDESQIPRQPRPPRLRSRNVL